MKYDKSNLEEEYATSMALWGHLKIPVSAAVESYNYVIAKYNNDETKNLVACGNRLKFTCLHCLKNFHGWDEKLLREFSDIFDVFIKYLEHPEKIEDAIESMKEAFVWGDRMSKCLVEETNPYKSAVIFYSGLKGCSISLEKLKEEYEEKSGNIGSLIKNVKIGFMMAGWEKDSIDEFHKHLDTLVLGE